MTRLLLPAALLIAVALPATATAKPSKTDKRNAQQECRAERGTTDASREAFATKYGKDGNRRDAFGQCVSRGARAEQRERRAARRAARDACREERGQTKQSRAAFAAKYGKDGGRGKAFERCVSQTAAAEREAADDADGQARAAHRNPAKACDAERGDTEQSRAAFEIKYGTNRGRSNAFGRCVSRHGEGVEDRPPREPEAHDRLGAESGSQGRGRAHGA